MCVGHSFARPALLLRDVWIRTQSCSKKERYQLSRPSPSTEPSISLISQPPTYLAAHLPKLSPPASNVNDTKTEEQTFRYRSQLSERNQNVLMCSKKGSRTFLFSPKTLNRNHNVLMCSRTF